MTGFFHYVPIEHLPVLINGDDILFRATPRLYDIWKGPSGIQIAGFKLSIGKNYFSSHYLTINSECYRISQSRSYSDLERLTDPSSDLSFTKVEYTNVGLLLGQSKIGSTQEVSKGRPSDTGSKPISDQYNLTIHTANDPLRAHKRFIHYHIDEIRNITGATSRQKGFRSLFASPDFQGLGFIPPPELKVKASFTTSQLRLAHYIHSSLQGYASHPNTFNSAMSESSLSLKLSFVDVNQSTRAFPVRRGPTYRNILLSNKSTDVLPKNWVKLDDSSKAPLLFDYDLIDAPPKEYRVKGINSDKFRKLSRKAGKHLMLDMDLLTSYRACWYVEEPTAIESLSELQFQTELAEAKYKVLHSNKPSQWVDHRDFILPDYCELNDNTVDVVVPVWDHNRRCDVLTRALEDDFYDEQSTDSEQTTVSPS